MIYESFITSENSVYLYLYHSCTKIGVSNDGRSHITEVFNTERERNKRIFFNSLCRALFPRGKAVIEFSSKLIKESVKSQLEKKLW